MSTCKRWKRLALGALVVSTTLLSTGCTSVHMVRPAWGVGWVQASDGRAVHEPSGIAFPVAPEGLRRLEPIAYGRSGLDVSIGYAEPDDRFLVTLFVSPRNDPDPKLRQTLDGNLRSLSALAGRLEVHGPAEKVFDVGGRDLTGHGALVFYGNAPNHVGSFIWLFAIPEQRVLKVRASYDRRGSDADVERNLEEMVAAVEGLLAALRW